MGLSELELRMSTLEANNIASLHAFGAIFTAIAEMDPEAAAGIPVLLEDMMATCRELGDVLAADAVQNISDLARMAAWRGR